MLKPKREMMSGIILQNCFHVILAVSCNIKCHHHIIIHIKRVACCCSYLAFLCVLTRWINLVIPDVTQLNLAPISSPVQQKGNCDLAEKQTKMLRGEILGQLFFIWNVCIIISHTTVLVSVFNLHSLVRYLSLARTWNF